MKIATNIYGVFESHDFFLTLSFLTQIAQKESNMCAILELFATNSQKLSHKRY
jgi:hypothetical protein